MVREVIALFRDLDHFDYIGVLRLHDAGASVRETHWFEAALTVAGADWHERFWAVKWLRKGKHSKIAGKRTDPPHVPDSARQVSLPLNFLAGGKPPVEWDGSSRLPARGRTREPG